MTQILLHRGPDDEGYYSDQWASLGVRRLSIIDLVTGNQPITNEAQTLWLVFNGEIYNHKEIRDQLKHRGHLFSTNSDSEVIIHAYEEYGDRCLDFLNGMFAFAIWDISQRRLFIARDRLGIKPLYYWVDNEQLVFGSELTAVILHPNVPRDVDLAALDQFLTLEYIPAPRTIFEGVRKLPPGHWLIFQDGQITIKQYWDIQFRPYLEDVASATEILSYLIKDSVRLRLGSDVPLGALLSGGIDSSTVVAFMHELSSGPVRTFSIGFDDPTYNELTDARTVALHFGTDHREEIIQPDISTLVEQLVGKLDEPMADFSVFPTYLVCRLASRSTKVVLTGDGGDEVFGGYDTYVAQQLDRYYRWLPGIFRQTVLPSIMGLIPPQPAKKGLLNKSKRFVEGGALPASLGHIRWMMFLNDEDRAKLHCPNVRASLNGATPAAPLREYFDRVSHCDSQTQQQYVDIKTYLVDNILTKVDRMSMMASIEARVPLLDHRIVEFALNLPPDLRLHRGRTKIILRRTMSSHLPKTILDKPKRGFSIPLKHWLRGPLRPLMTDLLSGDTIRRRGLFEPQTIGRWISQHLNGQVNHSHRLWALMVFELWQRRVLDEMRSPR